MTRNLPRIILNARQTAKSSSTVSKDSAKAVDDDDGDCVVLEGDPDKPVTIDNNDERDDDSDEIQVVSEKGQVACRDYPHSRHHCAKFPFASTPHDSYCDQCHCYVCDSLAPCGYWGNGISNMDHCHATDKDAFWKAKRQNTKKNNVVLAVPSGVDATVSVPLPLVNQSPLPPQLVSCNVTQNQAFTQWSIRPCSMSVRPGTQNITRQQGSQPPGFSVPNRFPGYIIPRSNATPGTFTFGASSSTCSQSTPLTSSRACVGNFGSGWQSPAFGSSPSPIGFTFGASSSSFSTSNTAPMAFGSSLGAFSSHGTFTFCAFSSPGTFTFGASSSTCSQSTPMTSSRACIGNFGSGWQSPAFGSSPSPTGFTFGASSSSFSTSNTAPMAFGSSLGASSSHGTFTFCASSSPGTFTFVASSSTCSQSTPMTSSRACVGNFGSGWQSPAFGSSPSPTGFTFGASSSSFSTSNTAPIAFGSSLGASSSPGTFTFGASSSPGMFTFGASPSTCS